MEHPIRLKYPIVYVLLSVVPIEPIIVYIDVLNKSGKNEKKHKNLRSIFFVIFDFDRTSIPSSSRSLGWIIEVLLGPHLYRLLTNSRSYLNNLLLFKTFLSQSNIFKNIFEIGKNFLNTYFLRMLSQKFREHSFQKTAINKSF